MDYVIRLAHTDVEQSTAHEDDSGSSSEEEQVDDTSEVDLTATVNWQEQAVTIDQQDIELDLSLYPTIEEVMRNIFPEAENANVKRYVKQISRANKLDPIVVIKPNPTWSQLTDGLHITMPWTNSQQITSTTTREGTKIADVYSHLDIQELHTVRDGICSGDLTQTGSTSLKDYKRVSYLELIIR
ncbi:4279_t:CDS:2 [Paraglomus brasilianum]|uniref:4279_t:CDS:1 n=1 Tax=Paraglomus brasilianum TaxID=144538 RepID=A0A9N9A5J7_9GLOM|nr:4279_t:CDS:2 [Paraglomus brasilianum]